MVYRSLYSDVAIPEMDLTKFVFQHSSAYPDRPALIEGSTKRSYNYQQLYGAICLAATNLARRGFKQGEVFAIYSPNLPEYAIAFHAVAMLGGIITTINPLYTSEELAYQLKDSGAAYLLTVPPFLDKAVEAAGNSSVKEIMVFGEAPGALSFSELLKGEIDLPRVSINPREDLVMLPYSSGTTGLAKGVMLTHYNVIANLLQAEQFIDEKVETIIAPLPLFHVLGLTLVMNGGLYLGRTIVTMMRFDLEQFLQLCQDYQITEVTLVPPIVLALSKVPVVDKYDLSKLTRIGCGAAPLGKEVEQALEGRLNCKVVQGYGMTEATAAITLSPYGKEKSGSVGVPTPNTEVKIVDPASGKELGPFEQGELWARGPQVMRGYLNQPEVTARTLDEDGWLHTGDVGYVDEDGYFYIVDRVKELIKYKAMQVAPAELEALLLSHTAVADVAVIGVADEEAGEIPKAFVVLKGQVTPEELISFVSEQVAPHKRVRQLEVVDQIPKSPSGKILRRVLVDRERQKASSSAV
ncbi:MAG TPA: AMP-binding protein [Chloroflexia bacterium]|nr:AMP-binding protein [Chloroflexia bacterium]